MSQLKPADQNPHGAPAPAAEPGFEEALHAFWAEKKNRNFVLGTCVAVLLGIIGWRGSEYFAAQHELSVRAEFARISDQPAQLAAFAESHSGHALAGVAWLQLADDKFSSGDFAGATAAYQKAAAALTNAALQARAKLGAAVSQVRGADRAGGEAALKALSADVALPKSVRAEAADHLATVALESGNADEVRQLVDQVSRIDATSPWSQRAMMLLTALPAGSKPAGGAAPAVTFKPGN